MKLLSGVFVLALSTLVAAFTNPISWLDLPDVDIRNINGTYYYSSSTFHFSPGAPVLRSRDLVNWEIIGHSVPTLGVFGAQYTLTGPSPDQRAYRGGVWASFFDKNSHDGQWYWGGCINFWRTVIYKASAPEGPWQQIADFQGTCFYDAGLLIDDDGTPYVSYKDTNIWVARLSNDFKSIAEKRAVFTVEGTSMSAAEGTRPYKHGGQYFILTVDPSNQIEYALRSSSIFGTYTSRALTTQAPGPVSGGSTPVQGAIVQANSGQWYYMTFTWTYPAGRIPVLAPMTWTVDNWPSIGLVSGAFATSYPNTESTVTVPSYLYTDTFAGTTLSQRWEWNHDPDTASFTVNNGLTLRTATVTNDLYTARNTLTQRIPAAVSTATIRLDISGMANGDRAGLSLFRYLSAAITVAKTGTSTSVQLVTGINLDQSLATVSTGTVQSSASFTGTSIWLRAKADVAPSSDKLTTFSYSTDGSTFKQLGTYVLDTDWYIFLGYRFAIFNYATVALGGRVLVKQYSVA